ncbi:hypothetical protein B8W69_25400 [Mycobacterium vulneris]|jgi:hypothetical protein|uniref:Uncharacterized protein n=1 Tax=Mycolicibacterium vulneris TaxID=547163 RepID=A0A1X2KM71_9MYCO|nr:hypothetical protein [Mycolicibacterium vulneris]OSC22846.1 hypothetical protein B8W69_25400 [Mycolicibacterium vulneris]
MTPIGHPANPARARRRHIHAAPALFAGATAIATLALSGAAPRGDAALAGPQHVQAGARGRIIAVNDDDNDNPSSGDIFTQNAQDQSTASGAGTS